MLTEQTMVQGQIGAGILPTGQVAGLIGELPNACDLIERVMSEADETLNHLSGVRHG
jgi:NAD(P)H-dependent flavin oxidoreductase YrpB (nitropropane dioxygenase family)